MLVLETSESPVDPFHRDFQLYHWASSTTEHARNSGPFIHPVHRARWSRRLCRVCAEGDLLRQQHRKCPISEPFRDLFASGDHGMASTVVGPPPATDLDISLDRVVDNPAPRNLSATCELVQVAKTVNRLRQRKGIANLTPEEVVSHLKTTVRKFAGHQRRSDELLDRTARKERQRAEAKRVTKMFEREERARRRDGLQVLQK